MSGKVPVAVVVRCREAKRNYHVSMWSMLAIWPSIGDGVEMMTGFGETMEEVTR